MKSLHKERSVIMAVWIWLVVLLLGTAQSRNLKASTDPDEEAVARLQSSLVYPYATEDYQAWITDERPQVPFQLPFQLPFLGLNVDYGSISLHGYVSFNTGANVRFPFQFPVDDWPNVPDPTFLGPYVTPSIMGTSNSATMKAGVYLSVYTNVAANGFQDEVDLKAALQQDIRNASFNPFFEPQHVIIITWRNLTFRGNTNRNQSNTFQVVITTDEEQTYAIFNYEHLMRQESQPPFVGFNVGNSSGGFEYQPYSRNESYRYSLATTPGNQLRGRHIFRIDTRRILPFTCNIRPGREEPLYMSTASIDILGGEEVNITGPCFDPRNPSITVVFQDIPLPCVIRSRHRASCITTGIGTPGIIDVRFTNETTGVVYKSKLYSQDSLLTPIKVKILNSPFAHRVEWNPELFLANQRQLVNIILFGIREDENGFNIPTTIKPIALSVKNSDGGYTIPDEDLYTEADGNMDDIVLGLFAVFPAYQNPGDLNLRLRAAWSKPQPLDWFFSKYWERRHGPDWARFFCNQWLAHDDQLPPLAPSLPACPCTRQQIREDKGRFILALECFNRDCADGQGIGTECYRSAQATSVGSSQLCCYKDHELVSNHDSLEDAGFPGRAHPHVLASANATEYHYPWVSHWLRDKVGQLTCCMWLGNTSEPCQSFRRQRRSDDCSQHQAPNTATVFGDPHIITFDNLSYTFNGKGEFTLLTAHDETNTIQVEIQGRFQQVVTTNKNGVLNATQLTSVVIKDSDSCILEAQFPPLGQVGKSRTVPRFYLNGDEIDISLLNEITFLLPLQGVTLWRRPISGFIASFQSGMGIQFSITSTNGITVYLPPSFKNSTAGLLGSWSGQSTHLTPPADLHLPPIRLPASIKDIHDNFGLHWSVTDNGIDGRPGSKSLFNYDFGRSSKFYTDKHFRPYMGDVTNESVGVCGGSNFQCQYDYVVTSNEQVAGSTLSYFSSFTRTKSLLKEVVRCPALPNPANGTKDTTQRIVGTKVTFTCDQGYTLKGEDTRYCLLHGQWSTIEGGEPTCVPNAS